MIGKIIAMFGATIVAGVAVSSFKHYYNRYADEQDLLMVDRREVVVVENQTKEA